MPPSPLRGRGAHSAGIVLALLATLGSTSATSAAQPGRSDTKTPLAGRTAPATPGTPRTITLINGDRVSVTGSAASPLVEVTGSQGQPVTADTAVVEEETYVYPREVLPYVAAGVLDKQLFNVTRLLDHGYDDARGGHLPMILQYRDKAHARKAVVPEGAESLRRLTSIQGAAVARQRDEAATFWSSLTENVNASALRRGSGDIVLSGGIERVWLDGKVEAVLSDTVAQVGAPEVWTGGNTGEGVAVAVLDSGADTGHPDLVGRIAATKSFVPGETIDDVNGHGTHVASTIAGTGAASGGKEKGVAPGARLHIAKALDDSGSGQESWVVAAMEWAARDQKAKVVSMSLGGSATDGTDPLSSAVNSLSAETGALFTVAAGNSSRNFTVGTPGAADAALTVGAVDSQDTLAGFSSRGPRVGDHAVKPEITAPGVDVLAARSRFSPGEGAYVTMSGTSMATPHVAGTAALLAAEHPDWAGTDLKNALVSTAVPTAGHTSFEAGNGRVDAAAATRASVFATGVVSVGLHEVPAAPGRTVEREVIYTNRGNSPVTLELVLDAGTAPAGLFALTSSEITVPPGGTNEVTLLTHLDHAAENHAYTARITASEKGAVKATTAVGLVTESEKAVVDLAVKDRSGKPATGTVALMAERAGGTGQDVRDVTMGSSARLRLEPGLWSFSVLLDVEGADGPDSRGRALITLPEVKIDRDMSLALDASRTRQVTAATPRYATATYARVDFTRALTDTDITRRSFHLQPHYDSFFASPTSRKVTKGALDLRVRWRKEEPSLTLAAGKEQFVSTVVRRGARTLPEGSGRLDAVYMGRGAPEDYVGRPVHGRAALVQRDDDLTMAGQAAAAAAAGARILIVADSGSTRMDPRTPLTPPLRIVTVGPGEGRRLVSLAEDGPLSLRLSYDAETDYVYDLVSSWQKSLPNDLTYRPSTKDLARVDVSFEHHRAGDATEFRHDLEPGNTGALLGSRMPSPAQGARTDWVTGGPGVEWRQTAAVVGELTSDDRPTALRSGSRSEERWFAPVGRPRSNEGRHAHRGSDYIMTQLTGWGDSGGDHEAYLTAPGTTQTASLYQGDELLARTPGSTFVYATGLKPQRLPYRYVLETSHGTWTAPYSTRTKTSWDFVSGATEPDEVLPLPLIQLDYTVDTDAAGKAKRNAELILAPSHLTPSTPGTQAPTTAMRKAGLEVSYDDGATWRKVSLVRAAGGWWTKLDAPRHASYVTVRATASDDRGNAVEQTVVRAFGLK